MGNLEKILKMAQDGRQQQKVVLVSENWEPFVILPWEEYQSLSSVKKTDEKLSEHELLEKINKDIALLNEIQRQEEESATRENEVNHSKIQAKEVSYEEVNFNQTYERPWPEENIDRLTESEDEDHFYSEPV